MCVCVLNIDKLHAGLIALGMQASVRVFNDFAGQDCGIFVSARPEEGFLLKGGARVATIKWKSRNDYKG